MMHVVLIVFEWRQHVCAFLSPCDLLRIGSVCAKHSRDGHVAARAAAAGCSMLTTFRHEFRRNVQRLTIRAFFLMLADIKSCK
jgi:hypothetical protein